MNKPTENEIRKLWEWCGIKETTEYREVHCKGDDLSGTYHFWRLPDGKELSRQLSIDLKNLFKWAVPKLTNEGLDVELCTSSIKGFTATVYNEECFKQSGDDNPDLALFWAIFKTIGE